METIHGAESWRLRHGLVDLAVTKTGGQMAPVSFDLGNGDKATPYSLPPWLAEDCEEGTPELLKVLRGDFFCLPFGVSKLTPHPHGAPANLDWTLEQQTDKQLTLSMHDPVTGGDFLKEVLLKENHRAIYIRHAVRNLEGRFNYGHHPILEFPEAAGPCALRTGKIRFGQVYPGEFEGLSTGGSSSLKPGSRFDSLDSVQLAEGGTTSLASYPARAGSEDLVMYTAADEAFGWTAVHFPGFVWMALRNCRELPSTLLWHSNGGRPYGPWNGQHVRRLGIEDVCSYFHEGAEISAEDRLADEGIPTSSVFLRDAPRSIHHIQLVHPLDDRFGTVESVERDASGKAILIGNGRGLSERIPVDWNFLAIT